MVGAKAAEYSKASEMFHKAVQAKQGRAEDAKAAAECARATRVDAVPVLVLIIKCCQQKIFFFSAA
jgi:hypothetical protein